MFKNVYLLNITNGRFTIPAEIRHKFGFFGKKVEIEANVQDGKIILDFTKNKK